MRNRVAWWLWVICYRRRGRNAEEARQDWDRLERMENLIAASGLLDEVPDNERHWNRLARNVVWLVAPFCSLAILLVTLKGLSPWIKYPLAIMGMVPLTFVVALIFQLITGLCVRVVSRQRRSE
jgi:hypothetical protein